MGEFANVHLTSFSDAGTVRDNNEDNLYSSIVSIVNEKSENSVVKEKKCDYVDELMLFAVFDGIGGSYGGEIASLCAAKQFSILKGELDKADITDEAILSEIFARYKNDTEQSIMSEAECTPKDIPGTTCCAFFTYNGKVRPFWIGDSRLYMLRGNKLILLTKDHTIAQEKIDYGLISPEEALTVSSWHHITAYIGDMNNKFSIGREFELQPGDKFLLCSDGVSDKFKVDQIAKYMSNEYENGVNAMIDEILKESKDNATFMLIDFREKKSQGIGQVVKDKLKNLINDI